MTKDLSAWAADRAKDGSGATPVCGTLHERLVQSEAEVARLHRCMALRDAQLAELRQALAHCATLHYSVEDRLQRELDALRIMIPAGAGHAACSCASQSDVAVVVTLPYITSTLSVLFDAMRTFWANDDSGHLPKSTTVAHAIDERLGLSSQANGEASRSGQAYASAIRPDWVKEADNRHHCRPSGTR